MLDIFKKLYYSITPKLCYFNKIFKESHAKPERRKDYAKGIQENALGFLCDLAALREN